MLLGGFKFSQNDLKEIANKKTPDEITQERGAFQIVAVKLQHSILLLLVQ